ncbi:MAG: cytochrome B [Cyanobacteria bacterium]|jgi:cytochrome b561|nr:cytochrome B [Cyanobacteria bacterium GSL.Bin21]
MSSQTASSKKGAKPKLNSAFQRLWSLHWWMAIAYLILFIGGVWMVRMPQNSFLQNNAYDFHKSMGALTMGLLTLRIFTLQQVWWRKYTHRSPKINSAWVRTFLLHTAIYIFMLAVPISGFFFSNSYQSNNVTFFWLATLPDLFPENSALVSLGRQVHFWLAYTFLAFIGLHVIDQKKYVRALWRRSTKALQKRFANSSK